MNIERDGMTRRGTILQQFHLIFMPIRLHCGSPSMVPASSLWTRSKQARHMYSGMGKTGCLVCWTKRTLPEHLPQTSQSEPKITVSSRLLVTRIILAAMSHIFGCKQTPPTPPTTSDEVQWDMCCKVGRFGCDRGRVHFCLYNSIQMYYVHLFLYICSKWGLVMNLVWEKHTYDAPQSVQCCAWG